MKILKKMSRATPRNETTTQDLHEKFLNEKEKTTDMSEKNPL